MNQVTEPLGLYDCCPTTDGAAALILCKAELAEKRFSKKDYILIDGMGLSCATGYITTAFNPKFKFYCAVSTFVTVMIIIIIAVSVQKTPNPNPEHPGT